MAALLVFIMATLETVFGRKKLLDRRKRPVWRKPVIKNPAIDLLKQLKGLNISIQQSP